METLSGKRLQILQCIADSLADRGYPPSVREIATAVGLSSTGSVHAHLSVLQREGYLEKDPTKPRAIKVNFESNSGLAMSPGPVRHVPLIGDVAAGVGVLAQENVEEMLSLPERFTPKGTVFMLRVRGDSMINEGIFDGDYVVVRAQKDAEVGELVVAGIPGEEATVKRLKKGATKVILMPANDNYAPMEFEPNDVAIYGKVFSVMRSLN